MTAPPTNPLHLFRSLLRECSYLPDARARVYCHHQVIWSFRQYLPKTKGWRKTIPLPRQVRLLHRGRSYLSLLRRAREGHLKPLEKVLMLTYGRTGRRRRELMDKLMRVDTPSNSELLASFKPVEPYTAEWQPPAVIQALLSSQAQVRDRLDWPTQKMKMQPQILAKNIWGKQMPECRVQNMTHKWYAKSVDQLYPPLPDEERHELRDLATGLRPWQPVPRRAPPRETAPRNELDDVEKTLIDGPPKGPTFGPFVNGRPHILTPRLMRRMWATVYKHVPRLQTGATGKPYTFTWEVAEAPPAPIAVPSKHQAALLFGSEGEVNEREGSV